MTLLDMETLLRALPSMLHDSGARLEHLRILISAHGLEAVGEGLPHLADALRSCSPTLEAFVFEIKEDQISLSHLSEDFGGLLELLCSQLVDLLAGVSSCQHLRELVLPAMPMQPLSPPGTAFSRLTYLDFADHEHEGPRDAPLIGLWEVMSSGGLPVLAKLRVGLMVGGHGAAARVKTLVAPAFEAVAGTLTHLHLAKSPRCWSAGDGEVGYELGVAVGKLRRLKDLALNLSQDGRFHDAFARGLAVCGGSTPLPLLWRVQVLFQVSDNVDQLASLLLPSVRVFTSDPGKTSRDVLLLSCALRQVGYKHTWGVYPRSPEELAAAREVASCRVVKYLEEGACRSWWMTPSWWC
jgi:hypothetical protein